MSIAVEVVTQYVIEPRSGLTFKVETTKPALMKVKNQVTLCNEIRRTEEGIVFMPFEVPQRIQVHGK